MAADSIGKPGTKYGPCEAACIHEDCKVARAMAEAICLGCKQPIGYGQKFYTHTYRVEPANSGLWHVVCLEEFEHARAATVK